MVTPIEIWASRVNVLAEAVTRLQEAVTNRQPSLAVVRRKAVEDALKTATAAASAVASTGLQPPAQVQEQWIATLTRMDAVLRAAQALALDASVNGGSSAVDTAGFRIPGTAIIVPWAAVLAVLAVGGVAWYVSRRKR